MKDFTDIDLKLQRGVVTVVKKPVLVQVDFASRAGVLATLEGSVAYSAGDALLTGLSEEGQWPVSRAVFLDSYIPVAPTKLAESGLYKKKKVNVLALQVDHPFCINLTGERGQLTGNPGDWLVEYSPGELGVLASSIFSSTYEQAR